MTFEDILMLIFFIPISIFFCFLAFGSIKEFFEKRAATKKEKEQADEIEYLITEFSEPIELSEENEKLKKELVEKTLNVQSLEEQILSLQKTIDELKERNDNQAADIRKLRRQSEMREQAITYPNSEKDKVIHERDEEIARLNKRIEELERTDPKEFTRQAEIELKKRKEELKARKEARIRFAGEFKKALKEKIDFEKLNRGIEDDAFTRAFEMDNSVLSLVSLDTFNVSATIHSVKSATEWNNYTVTLKECGCDDHKNRKRTCKHMVYLAYSLGLLQEDVVSKEKIVNQYNAIRKTIKMFK